MKTIYKYTLPQGGEHAFYLELPEEALVMSAQMQNGRPYLWAFVDTELPIEKVPFEIRGTGNPLPDDFNTEAQYINTYQDGAYVWHLFIMRGE